jgi:hypothetical protein
VTGFKDSWRLVQGVPGVVRPAPRACCLFLKKKLLNRKPAWTWTWLEKALDTQRIWVLAARVALLMPSLTRVAQSGCRTLRGLASHTGP